MKSDTFTMDQLVDHLLPEGAASKWQDLGAALSLGEDILDEIFTNNDRDEDCLRDMLERYMMRSDLKHNWEEINKALAAAEKASSGDQDTPAPAQETSAHISRASTGEVVCCVQMYVNDRERRDGTCTLVLVHVDVILGTLPTCECMT